MKECMECGKKLGALGGYRHPTMGNKYLVCSSCFTAVCASVQKWAECISPNIGFFNKETSTLDDIRPLRQNAQNHGTQIQQTVKKVMSQTDNLLTKL